MGRGAAWIASENRVLAECWLSISEDPVKGSDQDTSTFWDSISQLFEKNRPRKGEAYARTTPTLTRQWAKLRRAVSKFAGCFKQIVDLDESGKTMAEKIEDAMKLYEAEVAGSDSHEVVEVWRVLRDKPKWRDLEGSKQKSATSSAKKRRQSQQQVEANEAEELDDIEVNNASEEENSSNRRPRGRKAAKEDLHEKKREAGFMKAQDKIAEAAARMAENSERKAKTESRKFSLQLFTQSTDGLDDNAKEFIELMKQEILQEKREEQLQLKKAEDARIAHEKKVNERNDRLKNQKDEEEARKLKRRMSMVKGKLESLLETDEVNDNEEAA